MFTKEMLINAGITMLVVIVAINVNDMLIKPKMTGAVSTDV